MMQLMRQKDSAKAVEATLDAQEKFNRALEAAKDQFSGLVTSGVLDMFTSYLPGLLKGIAKFFGSREDIEKMELQQNLADKLNEENNTRSKKIQSFRS